MLFETPIPVASLIAPRWNLGPDYPYDVIPDGQRFLISAPLGSDASANPAPLTVILNWPSALKR